MGMGANGELSFLIIHLGSRPAFGIFMSLLLLTEILAPHF